jgi:excisionase family DNA binding protein
MLGGSIFLRKPGDFMRKKIARSSAITVPSPVMTLHEVAAYLRVHTSTVYRLLKKDKLPAFKFGSDWRFNREAIEAWMKKQQTPT